ncbi:MAG TPA: NAD(P)-dependent oxidoreductase [Burkholderiaceae bacterium]|mgnify:CR=1 FL=1|nr:NAD(P)-dependent oxidoreductase [Burkholderiaceae bacterium]
MSSTDAPSPIRRIASQFGTDFDQALRAERPDLQILPLGRVIEWPLPADVDVLLAYPVSPAERVRPAPAGWPFGLRWIQLISVGLDNYPPWLLRGTMVSTARGTSSQTIADYVLAQVLRRAYRLDERRVTTHARWRQSRAPAIGGQTLGIFGFGGIGRALAAKALALGMRVRALRASPQPLDIAGVERADDLADLMATSDHLVLAAPGTADTRHVINAQTLAHARPGLHLINVARGSLVDQSALLQALDDGRLDSASLDVTEPEPLPEGHPLYTHPKVFITPHTCALSPQVTDAVSAKVLAGLAALERGERPADLVDLGRAY